MIPTPPASCAPARSTSASLKKNLTSYVDNELKSLVVDDGEEAKPTAGFRTA